MHENDVLAVPEKGFVRLNALHLSSIFPKVHLPLQFTKNFPFEWNEKGKNCGRKDAQIIFSESVHSVQGWSVRLDLRKRGRSVTSFPSHGGRSNEVISEGNSISAEEATEPAEAAAEEAVAE